MKHLQAIVVISFFLCIPLVASAQLQGRKKIDSLINALPNIKEDKTKALVLYALSYNFKSINPDEGIKYGLQCLDLSQKLNLDILIGNANNSLGINYEEKADYPKALEYLFVALKQFEKYDIKFEYTGTVLSNIGTIYLNQTNYDKALEYFTKAIPIYEKTGKKQGLANTFNGIGTVYAYQKNYTNSFEYYTKAITINVELGNSHAVAEIFGNLGDNFKDQNNFSQALSYYNRAMNIYELYGDKDGIGTNIGSMGKCYLAIAKDTLHKIDADTLVSSDKVTNINKAINNLSNGIKLSRETGDITNLIDFSFALSEAYQLTGNSTKAYENLKLYTTLKDSVFSASNNQKIASLETKREKELKEKINAFQKREERIKSLTILAGFIVLFIIIYFIYRNYRFQKKSNKLLAVEKQKSDDLLLNILPAEVAEELKETGSAEAKYFDNVTVLFTDFVGFTKIAGSMNPQQLVAELHTCFKAFDEITAKYNIEKIKTIGDAYMAISGLPLANPNHALDIVNAAIDIKRFIYERRQLMGELSFDIRIGIHTGNVVAGIVGVKKFAYDIWGDTVNTAARMEQNSLPGKINISEATYLLVKHKIECTYRGEIEAKNKGMLKMYFVVA